MRHRTVLCWLALIGVTGCSAGPAASRPVPVQSDTAPARTLIVGQLNTTTAYGPWDFGQTSGGGASLAEIHTAALTSEDREGNIEARLAEKLPSMSDGSMEILPDGRLRTTWKLRQNVRWHDGVPFTADDMLFSWDVARHPELISSITTSGLTQVESLEAIDRYTIVITWKTTFYNALFLSWRELWPFPRHLLGEAMRGDIQAFRASPYFTTNYVHLGPFRLTEFGLGEQQIFERFDDYFLGRPKINTIIIRTISNANTLLANLKAGTIDIASEKTLEGDVAIQLRAEWQENGDGVVLSRQDNWAHISFQFDPQLARPIELSRDVRIRRGLYHAIDRDAMREFAFPGLPDTIADTFLLQSDPRGEIVGRPFARYRYDPTLALQELAAAGWNRAADGRLLNRESQQVQIQIKGEDERWAKQVSLIADSWRQLGIDAVEYIPSRAVARDREQRASFPAVTMRARSSGEGTFGSFDSRLQATPQNRWQGGNLAHYANPELDRLIDKLSATLDERAQAIVLRDMGEIMASDLPALPMYFAVTFAVVRKGIVALSDDYSGHRNTGLLARNAHLWDRQ